MSYAAELKHFDDTYQAITAGYQESPTSKREVLDHIGSKLEAAKIRFYEVNQQSGQVPEDDLQLDELLTPDERELRNRVREFVVKRFMPVAVDHHRAGTMPLELAPELG